MKALFCCGGISSTSPISSLLSPEGHRKALERPRGTQFDGMITWIPNCLTRSCGIYKWGWQECRALWHLCFLNKESGPYCGPCSHIHFKNTSEHIYTFRNKILYMPTAMHRCNLQLQRISPEWQFSSSGQDKRTNSGNKIPFSSRRVGT